MPGKIVELWNAYVPEHLLPRLHGYELMMAPYAIAHMKIGLKLYETGYRFESDERAPSTSPLDAQDFSEPALAKETEGRWPNILSIPALAHRKRRR